MKSDSVLIARAPVLLGLGGFGTDNPSFYEKYGGFIIGSAINYYAYTILSPSQTNGTQIISANDDRVFSGDGKTENGALSLPKAIVYYFNISDDLTIFLTSQVPEGSGLGLSGSIAVSMIKAVAFWCGLDLDPLDVAELACYIQIDKMGIVGGKQSQYIAATGGLHAIEFSRKGTHIEPLNLTPKIYMALQRGLMLFLPPTSHQTFTSRLREALAVQQDGGDIFPHLERMKNYAFDLRVALERGDLTWFSALLHQTWLEKRELYTGCKVPFWDQCYQIASECGATGGMVTGSGEPGALLLFCPEHRQSDVTHALQMRGLKRLPFVFEPRGVQILKRGVESSIQVMSTETQYVSEVV